MSEDHQRRGGAGYPFPVYTVSAIRSRLPSILDRFDREGPLSPPVVLGRHRQPEAAVVPYRLLVRLIRAYEEHRGPQLLADAIADRANDPDDAWLPMHDEESR